MRVEIWSDVVCPWCYIGKRKFEDALARFEGRDDVDVVWRPYQLDPTAPPGSTTPVAEAYARKFGGPERAAQIIQTVSNVAAEVGLDFHMERAVRANTLAAHRVLGLAEREYGTGAQNQLKEGLLQAYFVDGRNVGDTDTLVALAAAAGLDAERVQAMLDGDEGVAETRAEIAHANDLDITAVPTFVFDGRWTIPGAQDPELFLRAFRRVAELVAQEAAQPAERARANTDETPAGDAAASACVDEACEV